MSVRFLSGDCREILPTLEPESFDCVVTSPPYFGLRDYGVEGQIGLESTLDGYVAALVGVFDELWRVLKPSGTAWLNLGDSYYSFGVKSNNNGIGKSGLKRNVKDEATRLRCLAENKIGRGEIGTFAKIDGLKPKDLIGVPWRVAFALQARGWWMRSAIVWHKPNPMPESVTDRPTSAYEMVFLLTKAERYFYDAESIAEECHGASGADGRRVVRVATPKNAAMGLKPTRPYDHELQGGRNARNVWTIATQPYRGSHFATMPPDLAELCIKAGCPREGRVLDPFGGAGTTGLVADRLGRHATLIELNPSYIGMGSDRIRDDAPLFAEVEGEL